MDEDIFDDAVGDDGVPDALKDISALHEAEDHDERKRILLALDQAVAEITASSQKVAFCKEIGRYYGQIIGFVFAVFIYSMLGGFLFEQLESANEIQTCKTARSKYQNAMQQAVTTINSIRTDFTMSTQDRLDAYQSTLETVRKSYTNSSWNGNNCDTMTSNWNTFCAAIFSLTVITTVGYGFIAPVTFWGRIVLMIYALFGIPLTLMTLATVGNLLAEIAQFAYHAVCCCAACRKEKRYLRDVDKKRIMRSYFKVNHPDFFIAATATADAQPANDPQRLAFVDIFGEDSASETSSEELEDQDEIELEVLEQLEPVPWIASIFIIGSAVFIGGSIFASSEDWGMVDATYFSFVTITTIGFGDIYPSLANPLSDISRRRFIIWMLFIFSGLAVVSMSLNMIQLDVGKRIVNLTAKCRGSSEEKDDDGVNSDSDDDDFNRILEKVQRQKIDASKVYHEAMEKLPRRYMLALMMEPSMTIIKTDEVGERLPFVAHQHHGLENANTNGYDNNADDEVGDPFGDYAADDYPPPHDHFSPEHHSLPQISHMPGHQFPHNLHLPTEHHHSPYQQMAPMHEHHFAPQPQFAEIYDHPSHYNDGSGNQQQQPYFPPPAPMPSDHYFQPATGEQHY